MLNHYLGFPRSVYILCIGTFINRAGTFLVPFLTLYLEQKLKLGERFATSAMGLYGLGSMCAALVGGHLADWLGRKTVMMCSLLGSAALIFAFSFLQTPTLILVSVVGLALVGEMYRPAASAMMGDLVGPARRGEAFGLLYFAVNFGMAIGQAVGGLLAVYSFKLLFWADSATSSAYAMIILLTLRETLPASRRSSASSTPDSASEDVPFAEAVRHLIHDRIFLTFCAGSLFTALVYSQSMSTLPLFLARKGFDAASYGRFIAVNGGMIVLLQLPLTAFLSRFDRGWVVILSSLVIGVGFALTAWAVSPVAFVATIVIWTIGELMQFPFSAAVVADLAPKKMRGRYMGMFGLSHSLAMAIGAPLGGEILARTGGGIWLACLGSSVVSAAMFFLIRKHLTRHRGAAPAAVPVEPVV
jgi:MFS family permease